ncbi:DUF4395 domain-containing protein [Calidifontibacter sp. DB0510]|uniref:DUF4395 domain-containing protein n=1 Tax=Metallococcus carri TaxID=1656884 RepID=A0A967EAW9_9MICO|nr:DUF4395 domain-containing protein [Metallococcus carri]NHN56344.1 DUF4395 domain-containing protein [Metallococcus carri]NOP35968.1 DUF4395 family protein [Calidifontibacter sp. DB2511S]
MTIVGFPNPVNEKAARVVATGVLVMSVVTAATGWWWLLVPLVYGFVARVVAGPRLSPLGQFATRVVSPRLGAPKLVPGPPKRFAQAVGVCFSVAAAVLALSGLGTAAAVVLAVLAVFAALESIVGFCAGCFVFGLLMRAGVIPEETCEACADIRLRRPVATG